MSFRGGARLDPSQVEDVRGRGYGGPILVGGGGLGLLLVIAAMLLGINPLADYAGSPSAIDNAPSTQDCQTGADANRRTDCRAVGFVDSIQKFWSDEFARRGKTYRSARTVLSSKKRRDASHPNAGHTARLRSANTGSARAIRPAISMLAIRAVRFSPAS